VLAVQVRATLCCTGAVPFPARDCTVGPFDALLAKLRFADAAPETWGVNFTVKGTEFPVASVSGNVIPLNVNSALLILADDTVTEPPLAVSVPLCDALLPIVTLPKLMLAGATASCPGATPVPLNAIEKFGLEPFEVTASVSLAAPATAGVKVTLNV